MKLQVLNIRDVAEAQLCLGCGACAYVSPDEIEMIDVLDYGRRPRFKTPSGLPSDPRSDEAMRVCPGIELEHTFDPRAPDLIHELVDGWGPILEVWEGYASDEAIRFAGSSGGAASALALYCIEKGGMHGLLHIAARPDVPYLNHTVMSRTREQILAATGSRYAPASPCDSLHLIEQASAPSVFIGKPCDVAGAEKARKLRSGLDRNLGLTIGIFCAGTPSTKGTLEMMKKMGFDDPSQVSSVRYRGNGWPGMATVKSGADGESAKGNGHATSRTAELTYDESWGQILQKHRQWRCYICPEHTGEFADIAVGDPWYRPIPPGEPGRSLVLVRTERGRKILRDAMAAGYLTLERVEPRILPASQANLLRTRGSVWGRLVALAIMGAPRPRFKKIPMFRYWLGVLNIKQKLQSVYGTMTRVSRKGLKKRVALDPYNPPASAGKGGSARLSGLGVALNEG